MLHKSTFNFMERLIHIPIYKQLSSHRHFHGSGGGGDNLDFFFVLGFHKGTPQRNEHISLNLIIFT